MSGTTNSFGPVYQGFHAWLRVNKAKIKAPHNRTIIYSGWDKKSVPNWSKLKGYENQVKRLYGVDPKWKTIQYVLENTSFDLDSYLEEKNALNGARFGTMWDFATGAERNKLVSTRERQQIWFNFSIHYNKNASGKVWMWVGDTLKDFPDLLLAEIPLLLKNKKISDESMKEAIRLAPLSEKVWEKFRKASKQERLDGR